MFKMFFMESKASSVVSPQTELGRLPSLLPVLSSYRFLFVDGDCGDFEDVGVPAAEDTGGGGGGTPLLLLLFI